MKRILAALLVLALWVGAAPAARAQMTTAALLDSIQYSGFRYFWYEANPANGLIKDRSTPLSVCSIASTGFGLSAICVGVDHGWVSRAQAGGRVLRTLRTFWWGPQGTAVDGMIGYQGLYYHWLTMDTAVRTWGSELSTIDTALLFAGILDCKQYFTGADSIETQIRSLADSIYYRANWHFVALLGNGPIYMGWTPEPGTGFANFGTWNGYNEASILYLLAIGSPTHGLPGGLWKGWWCKSYQWDTLYGRSFFKFPPLFGHQYSQCWVDMRSMQDDTMRVRGITYFENSRRATLSQRDYCIANPGHFLAYSDSLWGITASDDPNGYSARGAPPNQGDNGTLVPTAALSSMPFTPDESIQVGWTMWRNLKNELWGPYGFRDAFNYGAGWYDTAYLGIDQGPIVLMIENHLNSGVWNRFMQNLDIQRGYTLAGFQAIADVPSAPRSSDPRLALWCSPNPAVDRTTVRYRLPGPGRVRLSVFDTQGRVVRRLDEGVRLAGEQAVEFEVRGLEPGVYPVRLEWNGQVRAGKLVRMR